MMIGSIYRHSSGSKQTDSVKNEKLEAEESRAGDSELRAR
mgnify:CR=1 FL=1|jgi:hypothetical protein